MKVGIVGCGLIGGKRAAAAQALGHGVTIVCDTNRARADALAKTTNASATDRFSAVIGADIDAVIVATPHDRLAPISICAVEAGKHVLVEKPAARTLDEARSLAKAAKAHGRIVKVGFNHRFHPAMLRAHDMVSNGAIGPIMMIRGRYGHGGRIGYEKEWRCVEAMSGGGELIDQGSHLIDLSGWYMGELELQYGSAVTSYWDIEVDDNCFLALKNREGATAWLHASWSEWKNMFSFEIYGKLGKLTIDGLGGSYGVERLTHHHMLPEMGPPETTVWEYPFPDRSWEREYENFSGAVTSQERPIGDIQDAVAMHRIINAVYQKQE